MAVGRTWLRRLAPLLALGCVGAVNASASTNAASGSWTADPEEQFLLDVNIRQLRLGGGVRAYATPEGTCVMFGDVVAALEVPIRIDLAAKKASGWAFKEVNRVAIDLASGQAVYRDTSEPLRAGTVRETPDGWCVDTAAMSRWFGIGVKPMTSSSLLVLDSEAKLPVELAVERQNRAAKLQVKPAKFDLSTLPQVKLPYRMWRAPALDFVVSGGVTYRAKDGAKVDRRTSIFAAGEIAHLSYDAQVQTKPNGLPNALRLRAYRSDPDGKLLGPLKATHFAFGDVVALDSRLTGGSASGRGALVTNRPVVAPAAFDRTSFEGDLPSGWDAEIYRNGELLAFAAPTSDHRYRFEDVRLFYGENQISIILYGPQGQIRTREEVINVGQDNVPPGKTWYWAGFSQPSRDVFALERPPDRSDQPRAEATASLEHGIDERTSVGALARTMLVGDERLTYVEGTVRRSIGSALIEVAAAGVNTGGKAARAQLLARFGNVNVSAEALVANDFQLRGRKLNTVREARISVDAPLRIGRTSVPAHAEAHVRDSADGTRELEAAARLSANINRFNLATDLRYGRSYLRSGPAPPGRLTASLIGSGRVGDVRLRGSSSFEVVPQARLRALELSGYWSATDTTDWEGAVAYDADRKRGRARISHVKRLNSMAIAVTGEAATDGSVAVGFDLNFSLDPGRGFAMSREYLARAGAVNARVYRDLNDNGVRDVAEPYEKGAIVTTGPRLSERPTDSKGSVLVGGLAAFTPVAVGVDETSLSDPNLVPRKALQVAVPRPGVPVDVEIGLVGGGDVEGAIVKSGGVAYEGLDLELVDAAGKVVATARTDFDGFFLFERVAYGEYRIRLTKDSATATGLASDLRVSVSVSAKRSVVRLGSIHVEPPTQIASAG